MTAYDERPWLGLYGDSPADYDIEHDNALDMFGAGVAKDLTAVGVLQRRASVKPGTTVTPEEVIAHCRERMAAYKYPRVVVLIDELPKTVTGKILRRELRTP